MPVSITNAAHYTWGDACDGWHLLQSDGLSVIQENMPPGTAETMHLHGHAQQVFYILSGEAGFIVDGKTVTVRAGESLHIPPRIPHAVRNDGPADLRFLVISAPKSHGDRVNI
ncbi:cupin domain-containing protein [Chitinophaga lutea]|uniref:Cupin domain-containing protein n=1 Tax=Chitinophaga lutea TaxID=2488634 RepID=A0A3N4PPF7_9BACT|nr:cupin domain-containing protein [Chitinophaga lutea]